MPEVHAKLSPSSAERWMTCPGSLVLSAGLPNPSSIYAEEGTRAHALAEAILLGKHRPGAVLNEMERNVMVYVEDLRSLVTTREHQLRIEERIAVSPSIWGTADGIVYDPHTATLYVRDLKYGAGVPVEVSNNTQLKVYALAAMLTMGWPAQTINVGIAQPRVDHTDGLVRTKDYDAMDLLDFHADLMAAEARVEDAARDKGSMPEAQWQDTYLTASEKGCRFCLAAPTCPKLRNIATARAKDVFADTPAPADIAQILEDIPLVKAWLKAAEAMAYDMAAKEGIPGWKLVAGRATEKWRSDITADTLALELGVSAADLLSTPTLLSPAKARAFAPGKNDKERKAYMEQFTTRESSKLTLVHDSDPRPAVAATDAKSVFSDVEDE